MQKAMLRQKEWKSLQNISLLDKRIPFQMSKWRLIQAPSTPTDSPVDIFGTRWISRRVLWDRSQWLTSWARPQSQHSTRSLVTACLQLYVDLSCSKCISCGWLRWWSGDWSSSSNAVSGCHQCQSGPAEPWEQNPNFTQVTAQPAAIQLSIQP